MPVQIDLLHLHVHKLDFSKRDFLARCCALQQHLNTQDEDSKHVGCNICSERNSILPCMKSWFKMALQHILQSRSSVRGQRLPRAQSPPDCQDGAEALGLLNPCELKVHTTHTSMTKANVHTIHLVQSIKCIQGLPNTVYAQNRALILR